MGRVLCSSGGRALSPLSTGRPPEPDTFGGSHTIPNGIYAELLDFYGIEWEYEPVEFVLDWDDNGTSQVVNLSTGLLSARTTTFFFFFLFMWNSRRCDKNFVTRKNRKIRRLAELYISEINVKILYRRF